MSHFPCVNDRKPCLSKNKHFPLIWRKLNAGEVPCGGGTGGAILPETRRAKISTVNFILIVTFRLESNQQVKEND